MKNAVLCLSASTVLLLTVACSKVKTVTVLAEQWETGQHRTCMYGHEKLYCFKPDEIPSLQPAFTHLQRAGKWMSLRRRRGEKRQWRTFWKMV